MPHPTPLLPSTSSSPKNELLVAAVLAALPLLLVCWVVHHVTNDEGLKSAMEARVPQLAGADAAAFAAATPKLRSPAEASMAALEARLALLEALLQRKEAERAARGAPEAAPEAATAPAPAPAPTPAPASTAPPPP